MNIDSSSKTQVPVILINNSELSKRHHVLRATEEYV